MTDKHKNLISFVVPYSFFAAACWHLPYWSTFDVNPFEYMGINDIIMSFIYPLVFSILGIILPSQIGYLLGPFLKIQKKQKEKETAIEEHKKEEIIIESQTEIVEDTISVKEENFAPKANWWRFLIRFNTYFFLLKLCIAGSIAYTLIWSDIETKWVLLPTLFQVVLMIYILSNDEFLDELLPTGYRTVILIFGTLILTTSIINSRGRSIKIRDVISYDYTYDLSITNQRLKILGKLGDYMILCSMDNKTKYIVPLGGKNSFEIMHFDSKKTN